MKLSIEEMARKAGVGSETWRRYEAGQPIRVDKLRGVCRALGVIDLAALDKTGQLRPTKTEWEAESDPRFPHAFSLFAPEDGGEEDDFVEEFRREGAFAAEALLIGLDVMSDQLTDEIDDLERRPRGTHLGELQMWTTFLPERWITYYDHEFCWRLRERVRRIDHLLHRPRQQTAGIKLAECVADCLILHEALTGHLELLEERYLNPPDVDVDSRLEDLIPEMDLESFDELTYAINQGEHGPPSAWFDV